MQNTLFLRRAIFCGAILLLLAQTAVTLMIIGRAREAQPLLRREQRDVPQQRRVLHQPAGE